MVEVAAELRGVLGDIAAQRAVISSMVDALIRSAERFGVVTGGSAERLVGEASAAYAAAVQRLGDADRLLAASAVAIVEYGRVIGVNLGAGAAVNTQPSPPQRPTPAARPSSAVESAGRSLPVRTGPRDRTTGVFNGEVILSGEDEASVADLRPFPGGGWPDALISHVESHVAARMRRQGLTDPGSAVRGNA